MIGEPSFDESKALRRECPQCGPVQSASAWQTARWQAAPPAPLEFTGFPKLVVFTESGTFERELWPGGLCGLGSTESDMLSIAGLDPADHASISAMDSFRIMFTFGVYGLPFCNGSELRVTVLDTRKPGASLAVGPLRFAASAPGQLTVRAPAGVQLDVAASMTRTG